MKNKLMEASENAEMVLVTNPNELTGVLTADLKRALKKVKNNYKKFLSNPMLKGFTFVQGVNVGDLYMFFYVVGPKGTAPSKEELILNYMRGNDWKLNSNIAACELQPWQLK